MPICRRSPWRSRRKSGPLSPPEHSRAVEFPTAPPARLARFAFDGPGLMPEGLRGECAGMFARFSLSILAMVAVVTASNVLVQFPVQANLGPIHLGDILTWGAFTYPFAFLVSDLTNRYDGPRRARAVVLVGFAVALCLSAYLSTP